MNLVHSPRRLGLRRTALAVALIAGIAGSATSFAQSNASGVIFGRAESGTIHLENTDTGLTRDIEVGADGRYRASSLPIGVYKVSLVRNGATVDSRSNVQVTVGQGADVSFAGASSAANAQNLEGVQVIGTALPSIDVSNVDSRTVLTSQQLQKLPIGQNVNAAALLAPGSVSADSRYGNAISLGGASAAENQYYVNGFPVTNPLTGLGFSSLPFDSIDQEQVFTGGYGAEYGRSTGGVVNIITKRGSNTWKGSVEAQVVPRKLKASPRSIYYPNTGNFPNTDGRIYQYRNENKTSQVLYNASIGGPLIKDKLFIYAAGEYTRDEGQKGVNTVLARTQSNDTTKITRWLGKIDWNITDSNILELTGAGDDNLIDSQIFGYSYVDGSKGRYIGSEHRKNTGTANSSPGGTMWVSKYTGYVTDDLTVSALYGKSKAPHLDVPLGSSGGICPNITDNRTTGTPRVSCAPVQGNLIVPGANDKTKALRFDVEYRLGAHDLRAGIDNQTLESFAGLQSQGGATWVYTDAPANGIIPGYPDLVVPPGATEIAQRVIFSASGNTKVEQEAQFIEDHWQVSDRWLAYIGLRNEQFKNFNTDGDVYVKQRHQLAPRLGVTWDVYGDSTLKIYANAGRYHLAVPSNVAIRGAGPSRFERQWFYYTAVDPTTGAPSNPTAISGVSFANGANGSAPNPVTLVKKDLSAYYQDEFILGFDRQLGTEWTVGAKVTYRKLKSIIDDFCDARPFLNYAAAHNIEFTNPAFTDYLSNGSPCLLFNPGSGGTFNVDTTGNGDIQQWKLSGKDLGYPHLKRKYLAVSLYAEHQFADKLYGKVEYVWSKSYGNSEGLLLSDIGQQDPSVTQAWDFPELMNAASGYLPNDRRHTLKAYGYYQLTPEWLFGATFVVASGRPKNCLGQYPEDPYGYGAAFFYCNGEFVPRGTVGRLPWTYQLGLSTEYRPAFANHQLAFSADVINVFNQQRTQNRVETATTAAGSPLNTYGRSLSFSDPRYFRFAVKYDFSL
ncbi:TonB-dependent receptor [Pinirhizobacter soli]|uniref:TonB-dependent receptor n=1 Tax=Pinirhizobacter soli TaxID=2786953 RepID=UPI002029CF3E|nr:TonB-dependent receptor [Pinirhizobacter soli]